MKVYIVKDRMNFYAYDCGEIIIGVYKDISKAQDKLVELWYNTKKKVSELYKDEVDFDLVITDKVVEPNRCFFTTNFPSAEVKGELYGETYEVWIEEWEVEE